MQLAWTFVESPLAKQRASRPIQKKNLKQIRERSVKRTFKAIFCVFAICAMISFSGCGKDAGGKKDAAGGDTKQSDKAADDKGTEKK